MGVLPKCMYMQWLQRCQTPGTRCCGSYELNLGGLKEQLVLVTIEPPLQAIQFIFKKIELFLLLIYEAAL